MLFQGYTTHFKPCTPLTVIVITFLLALVVVPGASAQSAYGLALDFDGLENLGPGWAYEGWLIVDDQPVSTGTFTVDDNGVPSMTTFHTDVDPSAASAFVLTIEPSPDSDPAPSVVHLLGGDLTDGNGALSVSHPDALGTDLSNATGSYILNAPSGGEDASYQNGIWWLDPAGGPSASLSLPDLPDGWTYEGWVVGMDGPVSTGRFTMVSGADSDGAGPAAGPNAAPSFPGQDFVDPAMNLVGEMAVISVEPVPDNSPAPFTLKPLVDENIEDVGAGTLQAMNTVTNAFPTGSATLMAAEMMDDTMSEEPMSEDAMTEESMSEEAMTEESMTEDTMAESESMESSDEMMESDGAMSEQAMDAPEMLPQTGAEDSGLPIAALIALSGGFLLVSGAYVLRLRTR